MLQGQTGIPKETMRRNSLALGTVSTRLTSPMKKRTFFLGGVAILAAAGMVAATRGGLWSGGAEAQAPRLNAPRAVPIEAAAAVKKAVPVRIEVLGFVTPIASVAVKPRVDTEITEVHFRDGA